MGWPAGFPVRLDGITPRQLAVAAGGLAVVLGAVAYWALEETPAPDNSAELTTAEPLFLPAPTPAGPMAAAPVAPDQAAPAPRPAVPQNATALARDLQTELKRVGCYDGRVNGVWTLASRKAMQAFNDRVNAKLPIGKPDQILLALVQSHTEKICETRCPVGMTLGDDERCRPDAPGPVEARAPVDTKSEPPTAITTGSADRDTVPEPEPEEAPALADIGEPPAELIAAAAPDDAEPADDGIRQSARPRRSYERRSRVARKPWRRATYRNSYGSRALRSIQRSLGAPF